MSEYRAALTRLTAAQKPAYGAAAYSRWVNRPLGRRIAAAASVAKLTPNQVTGISAACSALAVVLLALAPITWPTGIAVAVLLALGYAFDSADGQLARLTGKGGPEGEWLDHVVDMAKLVCVHGAVLFSLVIHRPTTSGAEVAIVVGFMGVNVLALFAWLLVDLLQRLHGRQKPRPVEGSAPALRSLLRAPADWGVLSWLFVLWASPLFFPLYTVLFVINLATLVAALPVWFKQAAALRDPERIDA